MKRIIIGADVVPEGMSGRDPIPHFISGEMNNLVEQEILDFCEKKKLSYQKIRSLRKKYLKY